MARQIVFAAIEVASARVSMTITASSMSVLVATPGAQVDFHAIRLLLEDRALVEKPPSIARCDPVR
jgi:hypothetical protein